ncbi:protein arginine methyltransferase NDUFAF7, mitochondrial [Orussus abietinus]|uniref:protein arginine methyltransferase NDUFAF7, mitochondrial n=1 Tax=Orussus abietinus TaxID=222816 RepID=UPI00062510D7|nr:protein arginine methyltransferase NDUFAF7, mitochondrial [Orussus abietinus]
MALRMLSKHLSGRNLLHKKGVLNEVACFKQFYSSRITNIVKSEKNLLYREIFTKIMACGPITVAEYMKTVLTHPVAGYYTSKDVFGQKGDFTTSPEISQLFGEMIAVWIINEWNKITNNEFQLVELGPGRGSLARDIIRVFKQLKYTSKLSLHFVEISPVLSDIQAKNLCVSSKEVKPEVNKNQKNAVTHYRKGITEEGVQIFWYYSINDVPRKFSVFIAHEFFDTLPVHKFQKTDRGWNEILIDIDPLSVDQEKFRYVLSGTSTSASIIYVSEDEKRDHIEICPQAMVTLDYMASCLKECGGFALIADYGHNGEKTDTFRAFRQHKLHDPLVQPGSADLTADVDFSLLRKIAQKNERLITFGPVNQGNFLKELGIDIRLNVLLNSASDNQKEQLKSGYHMITDDDKMGKCFKMLSLFPCVLKEHLQKFPVAGFQQCNTANSTENK